MAKRPHRRITCVFRPFSWDPLKLMGTYSIYLDGKPCMDGVHPLVMEREMDALHELFGLERG